MNINMLMQQAQRMQKEVENNVKSQGRAGTN